MLHQRTSLAFSLSLACFFFSAPFLVSYAQTPDNPPPKNNEPSTSQPTTPSNSPSSEPSVSQPDPSSTSQPTASATSQPTTTPAPNSPKPKYVPGVKTALTILFTNDLYGQVREFRCNRPDVKDFNYEPVDKDFSNLLHLVEQHRKMALERGEPDALLFNTGDNLATSLASRFLLEDTKKKEGSRFLVEVMKRFRYDLIGVGNHEFSVSTKRLRPFLKHAHKQGLRFSVANLVAKDPEHPIAKYTNHDGKKKSPYFILERAGFKIGVFHVVPNEMEKQVSQHRVKGISFKDPKEVGQEIVKKLREEEKVDFVIALSHLEGRNSSGTVVREYLKEVQGIDLMISNELRADGVPMSITVADPKTGNIQVMGGYRYGTHLGSARIKLRRNSEGKVVQTYFQIKWFPLEPEKFDQSLRDQLLAWEKKYCDRWGTPLGKGRVVEADGMTHEQFMTYLLDTMRYLTKTEVALINQKAVKELSFPIKGYITRDDLFRAMPFNEPIVTLRLKGSQLKEIAEKYNDPKDKRIKLLFAGIADGKINGRPIAEDALYSVSTIRFIAEGAEGWIEQPKKGKHKLSIPIGPGGWPLRLRFMIDEHFDKSLFIPYRKTFLGKRAVKKLDKDGNVEIPYKHRIVMLEDEVAWSFRNENNLNFTSIFIGPINSSTVYNQKDTFNGGFFQKLQISGSLKLEFQLDTRIHLWITKVSLEYEADTNTQYKENTNQFPQIFQENTDRIQLRTEYHFRYFSALFPNDTKWYHTSPFVELQLETEFTRGSKPNLTEKEFLTDNNELFRHFETRAKAGLSFKLLDPLTLKIGFAWRKQWALELVLQQGKQPLVNLDHTIGASVDLELTTIPLFKVADTPINYESTANYLLTFIVGGRSNQATFALHELNWDNKIAFTVVGGLEFVIGFRMTFFKGAYRANTSDPNAALVEGPPALRLEPRFSIRYAWGARGQQI